MVALEHDLSIILIEELYKIYNLKDKYGSMNILYKYLYIRCGIFIDNKKVSHNDLINFILSELNIDALKEKEDFGSPYLMYYKEKHLLRKVANELITNLEFRANLEGDINLEPLIQSLYKKGYSKSIKYRKLNNYQTYIKYNRLLELNNKFGITPLASPGVEGFKTNNEHNPFKRSLEETLEANLSAEKFKGSHTTTHISEKQLEDYLSVNLELIEEGMTFFGRQIEVPGGIVDILAKDSNDNICIIELKINEDKSIVWQSMHYPVEIKKKCGTNKVRMITLAPTYSEHLLKSLKSLENVEVLKYNIKVSMGNIEKLSIRQSV